MSLCPFCLLLPTHKYSIVIILQFGDRGLCPEQREDVSAMQIVTF